MQLFSCRLNIYIFTFVVFEVLIPALNPKLIKYFTF